MSKARIGRGPRRTAADVDRVTSDTVQNRLWRLFPGLTRERLASHAKRIGFHRGDVVFRSHERPDVVYFPETAVISRLAPLDDGQMLEVGLIGSDGMAGISILPGVTMADDGIVQIPGLAVRLSAAALAEELRRHGPVHELLGKYAWTLLADSIQLAACNNYHSVGKRCARWLLMMDDLTERNDFPITQDLLAIMLGVRRATVTRAAQALHRAGVIDYKHGHVTVRDRRRLEAESCECYSIMRDTRATVLGY